MPLTGCGACRVASAASCGSPPSMPTTMSSISRTRRKVSRCSTLTERFFRQCARGPLMGPEAHLEWMRHWRRVKVEETAAAVKEVGAENFILATDFGQTGNPSPADGLQLFVTDLMKAGLTKDQITTMGREVTGKLLMG